jgi:hypothetical protein
MVKLFKATLKTLLSFVPNTHVERYIFNNLNKLVLNSYLTDTKSKSFNGIFYLGGQVKMTINEEITIEKIKEARDIDRQREIEYGGPCNSFEAMRMNNCRNLLQQMEEIINAYTKIMYLRELEKTKLNDDVNLIIVSFII